MIKKNIRQRKEYLYKKGNEIKDKLIYAKKLKLKKALESTHYK